MIDDPEHDKLVQNNKWLENFDEVVDVIKALTHKDSDWSWSANTKCKYVDIRIDMRDGAFVLLDRDKNRISLKQLMWQEEGYARLIAKVQKREQK